jgi:hypothetical protein
MYNTESIRGPFEHIEFGSREEINERRNTFSFHFQSPANVTIGHFYEMRPGLISSKGKQEYPCTKLTGRNFTKLYVIDNIGPKPKPRKTTRHESAPSPYGKARKGRPQDEEAKTEVA